MGGGREGRGSADGGGKHGGHVCWGGRYSQTCTTLINEPYGGMFHYGMSLRSTCPSAKQEVAPLMFDHTSHDRLTLGGGIGGEERAGEGTPGGKAKRRRNNEGRERGRWPSALLSLLEHSGGLLQSPLFLSLPHVHTHTHAHEGAAAIKPSQRGAQIERERTPRYP